MSSLKKDKDSSAPEAKECTNCLAPEGRHGVTLKACTRCKATHYCGRACQTAHWKGGHRQFCVTPKERTPQPALTSQPSSGAPVDLEEQQSVECAICLDPLDSKAVCTLPCTHKFHASCVEGLRSFGTKQVCPMCRVDLPPGPEKLHEEALRRYFEVKRRVDRGEVSWGALPMVEQREMNEVVKLWRLAAEQGHVDAQFNLGCMYENGRGVKQDYSEAVRWYRMAAEQGYADAQHNIGYMYENGEGVQQDYGGAVRWYRLAANQEDTSTQLNLGVMYENDRGVKQDYDEAVRWYRMAAEQGHDAGQCNLGFMFENGEGVKQDFREASRWYRKAADQGHARAQFNLGDLYEQGQGVEQNYGEAVRWYRKAAEQGNSGAEEAVMRAEGELRKQKRAAAPPSSSAATSLSSFRTCANCGVAETTGGSVALKPCSRCKAVVYCGKDCQKQHCEIIKV